MAERMVLNLTARRVRPIVRLEDTQYEIKAPNELSALDMIQVDRAVPEIATLLAIIERPEATQEDARALSAALTRFCALVLIAPPDVVEQLGDFNRLAVYNFFCRLMPRMLETMSHTAGIADDLRTAGAPASEPRAEPAPTSPRSRGRARKGRR